MTGRDTLLTSEPTPSAETLADWRRQARQGEGGPWLRAAQTQALARYALHHGEGVCMMEALAGPFHEPPRDISWEILGADPTGQNWEDHRDPQRAYALLQDKLLAARAVGAVLDYKIWLRAKGQ